jgi:hypothetical protein
MTTVTEAAKRSGHAPYSWEQADVSDLKRDPVLAQQFARRLAAASRQLGRNLSLEDLRDILALAVEGPRTESRIVEGRDLRKRVREQCAYSQRHGTSFAMVVLKLAEEPSPGFYSRTLEMLTTRLRRSDMVTVYRRRIAMLLPRMNEDALAPLCVRLALGLDAAANRKVVEHTESLMYPSARHRETQSVLDWLEDQLRTN